MVKGTTTGCTTCGTTPIPNQYMLARVTNECPEVRLSVCCAALRLVHVRFVVQAHTRTFAGNDASAWQLT